MNKIYLSGNLTKDPEVKYTQNGKSLAKAGIAVNRPFSKGKETDFFNLVAWGKTAEFFGRYLNKGSKILVEGRLQNNNYEDNKVVKHYGNDVIVDNVEFMDSKKKSANSDYNGDEVPDADVPF